MKAVHNDFFNTIAGAYSNAFEKFKYANNIYERIGALGKILLLGIPLALASVVHYATMPNKSVSDADLKKAKNQDDFAKKAANNVKASSKQKSTKATKAKPEPKEDPQRQIRRALRNADAVITKKPTKHK